MQFELRTLDDAAKLLEYFNHFHDSFTRSFSVTSRDRFAEIGCQLVTGQFDAEIVFAHYNFGSPFHEAGTHIESKFHDVSEVLFDLRLPPAHYSSGSITRIDITAPRDGSPPAEAPRFALSMTAGVCRDNAEWSDRESRLFGFSWAEFRVLGQEGDPTPGETA